MLLKSLPLLLLSATGTQALWLAYAQESYWTATPGGGQYESPFCQVGRGENAQDAMSNAQKTAGGAVAFADIVKCSEMPYKHTSQLGGFWNDYGTINYIDDNWHWYCNAGNSITSGSCDAGGGAPRKRSVESNAVEFSA
ncbi:hypothetical protein TGAM01_v204230 [Trichoderma gamsii]|uniref:Uncharacterized protein n=1 Tax=Trichoderma gamsii TaxID=398673 RepID=A0A2P4ZQZ7_9HYPO|nr:hypothetical protein TGAM01_v204230 [Trichoderma gamsii]PON26729.1 hypothetical protein TGAM01_v204230 [Trichoderma gamsii]